MSSKSCLFHLIVFGLFWAFSLFTEPDALKSQNSLQSPAEFLGYELGDHFTPHHRILSYMEHVAYHSDRATLHHYGMTHERRELVYLVLTTTDNHRNLEEIRHNNLRMTGLEDGDPTDLQKAIVWLSYNVHGNEPSGSEAAMKTLYELAGPANIHSGRWLDNTVVILDPMLNPDGRDRYVNWYNQMEGTGFNPLADAREHHEPWPGGRTNHFYFDLNRDWAWQTQIETQQRVAVYTDWMPHIHVDFHEQHYTAPYYFAPAAEPFHEAITGWQRELQETIGRNHAGLFDNENWLYFTREIFDMFYPGYGDTWPTFNGAAGMTYEQAGHGLAGRGIITPEGDSLTLADRLTRHHVTGMSTVQVASRQQRRILSEFQTHFHRANNNPEGEYRTYVVAGSNHPDKIHALLDYLDDQKIRYGLAGSARQVEAYNYMTARTEQSRIDENDIVVSAYQPQSQLVRVLFEPQPHLSDSLTYDITAWEVHYRFGLEGYALTAHIQPELPAGPGQYRNSPQTGNMGEPYAYLLAWHTMEDARFLADLLQQGIRVRFSTNSFTLDGHEFERGTLVIPRATNEKLEHFDRIVTGAAHNHARRLHTSDTGFLEEGPDLGSPDIRHIHPPEVAVLAGEGAEPGGTGEIWHFFDRQLRYPVTLLDTGRLENLDLSPFDVLVLPPGRYAGQLDEAVLEKIRRWIRSGGKLIAAGEANRKLAGEEGFHLSLKDEEPQTPQNPEAALQRYADRNRNALRKENPGSVYRITMDPTHPLAFGYDGLYHSLKHDANAFSYLDEGWNVGTAGPDALVSGFTGDIARSRLEHTLTFGVQQMDEGTVVYLADNPLFRGFWENGKLLFVNAVFLAGQ